MTHAVSSQVGRHFHVSASRALRVILSASAIALLVAASLTTQVYETRLASSISPRARSVVPRHSCTPTFCTVEPASNHVSGGWPYPFLPALLLSTSMLCGLAATLVGTASQPGGPYTTTHPNHGRRQPKATRLPADHTTAGVTSSRMV